MQIGTGLRLLYWIKKLAQAQERAASSLEQLARIETDRWQQQNVKLKPSQKIVFGTLNIEEANKEWDRRKIREALGDE